MEEQKTIKRFVPFIDSNGRVGETQMDISHEYFEVMSHAPIDVGLTLVEKSAIIKEVFKREILIASWPTKRVTLCVYISKNYLAHILSDELRMKAIGKLIEKDQTWFWSYGMREIMKNEGKQKGSGIISLT